MNNEDNDVILVCGNIARDDCPWPAHDANCHDCGAHIIYGEDPEVPDTALMVCFDCAQKRMAADGVVNELKLTTRNKAYLALRGLIKKTH